MHGGWFWIADRAGLPTVTTKIGYGQCFAMYAFSEYALATGDALGAARRPRGAMPRSAEHMADTRYGGYYEIMRPRLAAGAARAHMAATARAWMCTCT